MNENLFWQKITDLDNRSILKLLTARDCTTQLSIINRLREERNIVIPQPTFSNKIKRNGLKVTELQEICELYGYDIMLSKKA